MLKRAIAHQLPAMREPPVKAQLRQSDVSMQKRLGRRTAALGLEQALMKFLAQMQKRGAGGKALVARA